MHRDDRENGMKGEAVARVTLWLLWSQWTLACIVLVLGVLANYLTSRTQTLPLVLQPGAAAEITVYRFIDDPLRLRLRYADDGADQIIEPEVRLRAGTPTDQTEFRADIRSGASGPGISGSGAGSGAVQREVAKLVASGLVEQRRVGNQKRYRAFAGSPIHAELMALVHRTIGLAQPLREALQPLQDQVALAFVFGSVAKRTDSARSDIDLVLVSDTLGYAELMAVLDPLEDRLGRSVSPTLYTHDELNDRLHKGNAFLQRVLEQPKLWVIGEMDDLAIAEPGRTG